jgi:hypothetical protein
VKREAEAGSGSRSGSRSRNGAMLGAGMGVEAGAEIIEASAAGTQLNWNGPEWIRSSILEWVHSSSRRRIEFAAAVCSSS